MENSLQPNLELILTAGSIGMLLLTTAIVLFIYLFQRKLIKRKIAYHKIEDLLKRQELKSAYALIEGQDQERHRIATELHDDLGTLLVTLNMYADILLKEENIAEQKRLSTIISTITRQSCENVRQLSHRLDTALLRYSGLKEGLEDLVKVINETKAISVKLNFHCHVPLSREVSYGLYRIVQELVNNTLKHARASTVSIEIASVNNEYISLIYEDNGIGLSNPVQAGRGLGLTNIMMRVEKMSGQIIQNEKPKKGFIMVIEVPFAEIPMSLI